jgi:hypothetical protein
MPTIEETMAAYRAVLTELHQLAQRREQYMVANVASVPSITAINAEIAAKRIAVREARNALADALAGGP